MADELSSEDGTARRSMASLLGLSSELLHNIFIYVEPLSLDALSSTCRSLRHFVRNNRLLGKEIYLSRYDNPALLGEKEPEWASELRVFEEYLKLLQRLEHEEKYRKLHFILQTTLALLSTANADAKKSLNIALLKELFLSPENCQNLLYSSTLYNIASSTEANEYTPGSLEQRQLCAKLHCLYGTADDPCSQTWSITNPPFHYARSIVYDLRGYTEYNLWGPFLDLSLDARSEGLKVDWEKVEAIMLVLGGNMRHFSDHHGVEVVWDQPFVGVTGNRMPTEPWAGDPTPKSPLISQPDPVIDALDPYGVTGTWRRVVCFLDYNDFYLFNFRDNLEDPEGRNPIATEEAIRLITLKLYATRIEAPGEFDNPRLPVVHFKGNSQSMHPSWDPNANSAIRAFQGTVRLTLEGEIRWTTLSIFHGEPRWKSEGIQIGGLRSKRGVIGTWFDKDYDRQGPCGPTAFWKLSDEIEDEEKPKRVPHFDMLSL